MSTHTLEDDFQHFLTYSNLQHLDSIVTAHMRLAYEHGNHRPTARSVVASDEDVSGWLVEAWDSKRDELKALWWALGDFGPDAFGAWFGDSSKALRFARKCDAEAYIAETGWTEAKATYHAWNFAQSHGVAGAVFSLPQGFVDRVTNSSETEPEVMGAGNVKAFTDAQVDWLMTFNARLIVDGLHPEDARLWMRASDQWDFNADPVVEADSVWQDFFANPDDDGPVVAAVAGAVKVPDCMIVLLNHLESLMDCGKLKEEDIPTDMWNAVSCFNAATQEKAS